MFLKWLLLWMHPFYVSVVDINHNKTGKELEISIRIFTDDLEHTLQAYFPKEKVDLLNPTVTTKSDSLISRYIRQKFHLKADGKQAVLKFVGFEKIEESIWCYFETPDISSAPRTIQISNSLLYDYRKEQINMHNITVAGIRKSRKLDNPETELSFTF